MKIRRRNWWFRRMALGLAFAAFVAPAAAQPDESTSGTATATAAAQVDPYLTDVFVRPGEALSGPDGGSLPAEIGAVTAVQANDAAPAPAADSGWSVSADTAIALGLGALALALALGLAVGYARRPRIAGL